MIYGGKREIERGEKKLKRKKKKEKRKKRKRLHKQRDQRSLKLEGDEKELDTVLSLCDLLD